MGVEVSERGGPHDRARIVRRYLSALDGKKPGRSAGRTSESLVHRMHQIDTLLLSADPVQRLHLTQERIDLHAEHLRLQAPVQADFDGLEKAFIRVAKAYGDRHDVTYSAWRQIGVDANVLAQAGIHPPAKPNRQGDKTKDDAGSKTTDALASAPAPAKADKKPAPPAPKKAAAPEAKAAPAPEAKAAPAPEAKAEKKPAPAKKATTAKKAAPSTNGSAAASAPAPSKKAAAKKAKEPAEPQSEQQQLPAEAHLLS